LLDEVLGKIVRGIEVSCGAHEHFGAKTGRADDITRRALRSNISI
jgi:hypothetical protein